MQQPNENVVRGRCACGKRFRIRHARAGVIVTCPNCNRAITLTAADLRNTDADIPLIPLQPDTTEEKEATLVDPGELRPAVSGSRPGLTGAVEYAHSEAKLARAAQIRIGDFPDAPGRPGAPAQVFTTETGRRGFLADLIASVYLVGRRSNVYSLLATAAAFWFALAAMIVLPRMFAFLGIVIAVLMSVVGIVVGFFTVLYVMQFYWSVLTSTANGEDELSLVQADWDWWDDAARPLLLLAVISALCTLPALILSRVLPPAQPLRMHILWSVLALGWLFWPVSVMSVATGGSLSHLRPDLLIRCMIGIGPVYLAAWAIAATTLASWWLVIAAQWTPPPIPIIGTIGVLFIGMTANLYFGYVLFRTLGLLYRHFQQRFPWRV